MTHNDGLLATILSKKISIHIVVIVRIIIFF